MCSYFTLPVDRVKVQFIGLLRSPGLPPFCGNGPFFSTFSVNVPSLHHFPPTTLQAHSLQKPAHQHCCRSVSRGTQKLPASWVRLGLKKTKQSQAPTLWLRWIWTEGFHGQREWSQGHLPIEGQGDLVTWAQNDQEENSLSTKGLLDIFAFSNKEPMNRTTSVEWMQITQCYSTDRGAG